MARIEETEAQCLERYGPVLARTSAHLPGAESVTFLKAGIRVRVEFVSGRAVFISFSRQGLTEDDRTALLEANSGDIPWSGPETNSGRTFWRARAPGGGPDRVAIHFLTANTGTLEVATRYWLNGITARKQATTGAALAALAAAPAAPAAEAPAEPKPPAAPRPAGRHLEGF